MWGGIRYFARATVSDAWAVAEAPFHMSTEQAWAVAGVTAIGLALFPFDGEIHDHVARHRDDPVYRELDELADFVEPFALQGTMNKYYAAGVVVGYVVDGAWDEPRVRHIFEELLISNFISAATRKTLGRMIGRARPGVGKGPYHFEFWEGLSFPSGHAANFATLATVLSHHIDWWPASVLLYGTVGAVTYQRVADAGHWASDSWIGAFVGYAIARVVIPRREADHIRFGPVPAAGFRGAPIGITIRF